MDLPAAFIHSLVAAKNIMESQHPEDLQRLLECVDGMIAILKVRKSRHRVLA
jgi:hypothetical protein